jgi:NitT/TauT family transport system substrate-binding protein
LKQRYGFTDDQKRPYAFSVQPFLVDSSLSQQGFATSEPFSIEKGGVKPVVFLLAEQGYPPYSEVLAVRRDALAKRGEVLTRFVRASAEGWKSYLANPAPGNALIKRDNPQMSDELLAYGHRKMKEYAIVTGGDVPTAGLLTMTDKRWQQTLDFLRTTGLAKANVDYAQAWTLSIVKDVRVLP